MQLQKAVKISKRSLDEWTDPFETAFMMLLSELQYVGFRGNSTLRNTHVQMFTHTHMHS